MKEWNLWEISREIQKMNIRASFWNHISITSLGSLKSLKIVFKNKCFQKIPEIINILSKTLSTIYKHLALPQNLQLFTEYIYFVCFLFISSFFWNFWIFSGLYRKQVGNIQRAEKAEKIFLSQFLWQVFITIISSTAVFRLMVVNT